MDDGGKPHSLGFGDGDGVVGGEGGGEGGVDDGLLSSSPRAVVRRSRVVRP